jgi:L-galactose dehydrogenase
MATDGPTLPSTYVSGFHEIESIRKMTYRNMPHYGLVSVISFGASGLGGMFTAGQGSGLANVDGAGNSIEEDVWFMDDSAEDKDRAKSIVVACLKAGVNLIDSSHWYGQGRSERLLGHALADVPRSAYFINSKIGRYEKDPLKMFDFSYEKTYQGGLDTLRRLKLDCLDSLQVHDPEFAPSVEVILEQTLPALQRLKDEGKIRLIGMTGYPLAMQQARPPHNWHTHVSLLTVLPRPAHSSRKSSHARALVLTRRSRTATVRARKLRATAQPSSPHS